MSFYEQVCQEFYNSKSNPAFIGGVKKFLQTVEQEQDKYDIKKLILTAASSYGLSKIRLFLKREEFYWLKEQGFNIDSKNINDERYTISWNDLINIIDL